MAFAAADAIEKARPQTNQPKALPKPGTDEKIVDEQSIEGFFFGKDIHQ